MILNVSVATFGLLFKVQIQIILQYIFDLYVIVHLTNCAISSLTTLPLTCFNLISFAKLCLTKKKQIISNLLTRRVQIYAESVYGYAFGFKLYTMVRTYEPKNQLKNKSIHPRTTQRTTKKWTTFNA